jgi:threonine/homoserine/homoserine lactone efflux protein
VELENLAIEVIGISASGVLAPGPLFFANMLYGARQGPKAGLKMAYGHTVVELPLVFLLAAGILAVPAILTTHFDTVGLVGGLAILGFAAFQLIALKKVKPGHSLANHANRGPFVAGILFSALNPFFLVWWLTVGLKMLTDSSTFGVLGGMVLVFAFHIWMDYAWLTATAYLSLRGSSFLNSKYYLLLAIGLILVLVYYGTSFIVESVL